MAVPRRARNVNSAESQVLYHIPAELTRGPLLRLGEGIGKVVYASEHWVVCRERSPLEMVALILLWKGLRKLEWLLPGSWGRRLRDRPSRQIRFLRVMVQGAILVFPRALWFSSHIRDILRGYGRPWSRRNGRGKSLASRSFEPFQPRFAHDSSAICRAGSPAGKPISVRTGWRR